MKVRLSYAENLVYMVSRPENLVTDTLFHPAPCIEPPLRPSKCPINKSNRTKDRCPDTLFPMETRLTVRKEVIEGEVDSVGLVPL